MCGRGTLPLRALLAMRRVGAGKIRLRRRPRFNFLSEAATEALSSVYWLQVAK
jgi:hypothetical protein